ncbi:MAG: hypothetical protein HY269_05110 [Deltaproteobacteria bacterium]|nr:hypothetical protein [Deltaproteobacteria bacterium]
MRCYYCKSKISVLNRMMNGSFCRPAHRTAYLEGLNRLGLARLQDAKASMAKYETSTNHVEHVSEDSPCEFDAVGEMDCSEHAVAAA